MPGAINGFGLAAPVTDQSPLVGVLIVSGRVRPSDQDLPDGSGFLAKACSPANLLQALERVLAARDAKRGGQS
jgi:hypothetical protein